MDSPRGERARAKDYASLATHVTLPTWMRFLRLGGRQSTPKGVGREAPLTAFPRGATAACRSAGSDSAPRVKGCGLDYGLGCGGDCELSVRSHLAFCCAGRSSQNADQQKPTMRGISTVCAVCSFCWSAFRDDLGAWGPGGCGRGLPGSLSTGITRSGGRFRKTKRERNGGELRLHSGWWSQ